MSPADNDERNQQIEDWLRRARGGSCEALGQAFDACRQYLQIVAGRELANALRLHGGASDLVQETFLDAKKQFDNFCGQTAEQFLAWLTAILRSHAVNFTRQSRHTATGRLGEEVALDARSGAATLAFQAQGGETPSQLAQRREEVALEDALGRLPEDYRKVIRLFHREQLSFEEIAARLGGTEAAARKLWLRALERLEQELQSGP
jgi:RNA polymerase sigma-70 factor (ECF subfamily)